MDCYLINRSFIYNNSGVGDLKMIKLKDIGNFESVPQLISDIIEGNISYRHWMNIYAKNN